MMKYQVIECKCKAFRPVRSIRCVVIMGQNRPILVSFLPCNDHKNMRNFFIFQPWTGKLQISSQIWQRTVKSHSTPRNNKKIHTCIIYHNLRRYLAPDFMFQRIGLHVFYFQSYIHKQWVLTWTGKSHHKRSNSENRSEITINELSVV